LSLCYPLYDTDFWWHLKTGEWIVEKRSIPQVDLYTFTEQETPWIDLHWGFQLLITGLYHLGGVNLVILVKALIITAAVAVGWLAGGRALPVWLKVALWIPAVICISGRGYERPEMLSQLFLAGWLWMVRHVEERPRLIWFLPVLQVLWVNCHALFVLGLVVGACFVVDCLLRDFAQGRWGLERGTRQPSAQVIVRVGVLVAVACLVNPYFEEGALFPLTLYRKFTVEQDFYSAHIGEFFRPVDHVIRRGPSALASIYLLSEIAVWCIAVASFVWLLWRRGRWSPLRVLLFAGFSHLAWEATRNTNIFSIVSSYVACENFADALPEQKSAPAAQPGLRGSWVISGVLVSLIVAVVSGVWAEIGEPNKAFGLGEARNWFIHEAARFAGKQGFPRRAFLAHNGQAAVYAYHNAPERLVFMDARLEVCSRATFEEFNRILAAMARGDPRWQELFLQNKGELPVVILDSRISRPQINGMFFTPDWRLVFADRTAAVFLPNELADKLSLSQADPTPLKYPDGPPREP